MSGLGIVLLAGRGASAAPKPSPCRPGVGRGAAQAGTAFGCSKQSNQIYGQPTLSKIARVTGFCFSDDITGAGNWALQPPAPGNLLLLQNLIE